jgi:hypothetical protein
MVTAFLRMLEMGRVVLLICETTVWFEFEFEEDIDQSSDTNKDSRD